MLSEIRINSRRCSESAYDLYCPKYRAKRIRTEPRSGGTLLATGASRWNLAGYDQPHSGDSLKLPRLWR
jgi:hypothetical protein